MAVLLWILVPLLAVHLALWRWLRRGLGFQLLLDLALVVLFGPALVRGQVLDPVRCIQNTPPFTSWAWSPGTELQPTQSDVVLQFHPWWEEARRQLLRGRLPRIAPDIGGGSPLVANGQVGLLAPVMLPVWVLGPERGTTVMAVWKVEAAALGAFLFLAVAWRLRPAAAAVAGVVWGLGPFLMGWLLVPLGWSLALLPWVWWLLQRTLAGRWRWGRVGVAGGLLGWFMGAGLHPETAAIVVGSGLLAGLVLHPRRWARVAAIGLLAALVTVPLAWPGLRLIHASSKGRAYARENPNLRPIPLKLRGMVLEQTLLPAVHGHPGRGTWRAPYPAAAGALGFGGVALALLAAGRLRRRHRRLALAALAQAAVVAVVFFRLPPLDALLVRIPPFDRMTLPRFGLLLPWAAAVLAALAVAGGPSRSLRRRLAWLVPAGLLGLAVATWPTGWGAWDRALVLVTVASCAAGLGVFFSGRMRWLPWIAAVELVALGVGINPAAARRDVLPTPPVIERLTHRVRSERGRICGTGGVLPPNLASRYGIADLRSFDPLRPWPLARLHALLGAENPVLPGPLGWAPPRLLGAWSVRWLVTPEGGGPPAGGWLQVDAGDGLRVWENPFFRPEVRLVGRTVTVEEDEGWEMLALDPEMVLEDALLPEGSGEASARSMDLEIVERRPDRLRVLTACDGPCLLLLAQPWAPGWRASVDGRPAPVLRANLAALGVLIPAGAHEAELAYHLW